MPTEYRLEEISERYEVREALLVRLELNQQVDVALWSRRVAPHRAEQRQTSDAQPENLGSGRTEAGLNI